MKTPQEILAEWADPETGGTMPKEVREAALSVLAELERRTRTLVRIEDLAHDGQDRDAIHAFDRLATIEAKVRLALRGIRP